MTRSRFLAAPLAAPVNAIRSENTRNISVSATCLFLSFIQNRNQGGLYFTTDPIDILIDDGDTTQNIVGVSPALKVL